MTWDDNEQIFETQAQDKKNYSNLYQNKILVLACTSMKDTIFSLYLLS